MADERAGAGSEVRGDPGTRDMLDPWIHAVNGQVVLITSATPLVGYQSRYDKLQH